MSGGAVNETVRRLAAAAGLPRAPMFTAHGLRADGPAEAAGAGTQHPSSPTAAAALLRNPGAVGPYVKKLRVIGPA